MRRINYFPEDRPTSRPSDLKEVKKCTLCDVLGFDGRDSCYIRKKKPWMCPYGENIFENEVNL